MSKITKIIADFQTQLTAKISAGGTSGVLQSNLDNDGVAIPNGYYYFVIDGENSLKEFIYCLLTGPALSQIYSVSCQGVKTLGTVREHRYSASISITNFGQIKLLNDIVGGNDTLDGTSPIKYDVDATIDNDKHIGTKKYVDDATITPSAKASDSVIGISEVSVAPADALAPIMLGTNDTRIPTADEKAAMAGSSGTPGAANKFATNDHAATSNNMQLTGNQTVGGVKTFTSIPVLPGNPTTDNQISNKAYAVSILYTA